MKTHYNFLSTGKIIEKRVQEGFFTLTSTLAVLCMALLLISGCGSSSSSGSGASETGDVVIGLTDADGDFLTYTVDVVSLTLTKANGTVVETLPLSTTIDFAQYTEMTEFFTAATIPSGVYTHASMQLDYSNADIQVEVNGESVSTEIQDRNGNPVTMLDVTVKLDNANKLLIVPGVPAHLTLDFDLEASNRVDTLVTPPVVTIDPFLVASVNPEQSKTHRLRGLLKSVDIDNETFQVFIRPFRIRQENKNFGKITVATTSTTLYEIDGQNYEAGNGLEILSRQPAKTPVIIVGDLKLNSGSLHRFEAKEVYAGTSVPWSNYDVVTGNVIKREVNTLTVRGMAILKENGGAAFNNNIIVELAPETKVTCQATVCGLADIDDISIGQKVTVFGSLSSRQLGSLALDATTGLVRMLVTTIRGDVTLAQSGYLVLNLQSINHRNIELFDFTGTGTISNKDADPTNYEIDTGALNLVQIDPYDTVDVKGFVSPFGSAPEDFDALTVIEAP